MTTPTQSQPGAADALPSKIWIVRESRQNSYSPPGLRASEYQQGDFEDGAVYVPEPELAALREQVAGLREALQEVAPLVRACVICPQDNVWSRADAAITSALAAQVPGEGELEKAEQLGREIAQNLKTHFGATPSEPTDEEGEEFVPSKENPVREGDQIMPGDKWLDVKWTVGIAAPTGNVRYRRRKSISSSDRA